MLYELWRNYLNLVKAEFRNVCCGVKRKKQGSEEPIMERTPWGLISFLIFIIAIIVGIIMLIR